MIRLVASLVAVAALLVAQPQAQTGQPKVAERSEKKATVVNVNMATAADLEKLPSVGPKVAGHIIDYRRKKGPFKKIEELMKVPEIGEKSFLKLRSQITVAASVGVVARQSD